MGVGGANDPDNRGDMVFGDRRAAVQRDVLTTVQQLGKRRRGSTALRRGARHTLIADVDLYIYGRDAGDGAPALVILNRASEAQPLTFDVPVDWALVEGARFSDVMGVEVETAGRTLTLTVPARTAAVLTPNCEMP